MQPQQQNSRIDLASLKSHIVKKIGVERSKKYFFCLQRFLNLKLTKIELDRSCFRLLGRENLPLHNQLIRSILKNSCQAKTPPPHITTGVPKPSNQGSKTSPGKDSGHDRGGFHVPQNQNVPSWSNGVLPPSPRKIRSSGRDRKLKDRPSPLASISKVECHQATVLDGSNGRSLLENGELPQSNCQRPGIGMQSAVEQRGNEHGAFRSQLVQMQGTHSHDHAALIEDGVDGEGCSSSVFRRDSLVAPLGIPFCTASVGGARRSLPALGVGNFMNSYESGALTDTENLRTRMEQIAAAQGLGGVSMECANMLNNMVDVYLKRLITSCVNLVGARSPLHLHKQQAQGKVINGMWPSNHMHSQTGAEPVQVMPERRLPCSISMLDFKVAMELNPLQLGEDWPLLLEKISMHAFDH